MFLFSVPTFAAAVKFKKNIIPLLSFSVRVLYYFTYIFGVADGKILNDLDFNSSVIYKKL